MNLEVIIYLAVLVLGALTSAIPMIIKWNNARKAKKRAENVLENTENEAERMKAEADKKTAQLEMLEQANALIQTAETTFSAFDNVLKAQHNGTAGSLKKENVINRLQAFALSKGYEFDAEFWSAKIDEIVAFTKSVNSKR